MQVFDRSSEYSVTMRRLPHWAQAGTLCFITWQTCDSIPKHVLRTWLDERDAWLKRHGVDPANNNWRAQVQALGSARLAEFQRRLSDRWHAYLDQCQGACPLRDPKLANVVADSLLYFDCNRYALSDFVVMPNHLHVLVAFPDAESMLEQCESWKHFTATRINRILGQAGRFWQQDGFDHLVRSPAQFEYFRRYIGDNPGRANLRPGEFIHWSKQA